MMKLRALLFGKTVLSFILMLVLVVLVVNLLGYGASQIFVIQTPWLAFLWGYTLQTSIFLLFVYFWFIRRFPEDKRKISFHSPGLLKLILYVAFIFISYFTFCFLLLTFSQALGIENLPGFAEQEPLLPNLGFGLGTLVLFIIAVIVAPIVEEYIFRGWGMICLPVEKYPTFSIVLNGILFALLHFQLASILPLLFLGTMITWVRYRSGSLLPGVIFHVTNNSLAFLVELFISPS